MERLIYTYALIKSLYDQGEDYIDCFWPFAIKTFPSDKSVKSSSIQTNLREEFDLEMPLHVLGTVLKRARKKGYIEQYIEQEEKRYKLTEKGLKYLDTLETDQQVERRIKALTEDIKEFFDEQNFYLSPDQIRDLILNFLHKNIEHLRDFINPYSSPSELVIPKLEGNENLLVDYIKAAEQQKPDKYDTLQDMVLGSIISVVLYTEEPSGMGAVSSKVLKHCQIFLDTNFVFSILDLHHGAEFNEPARELFRLLRKYRVNLKVFDFTIDEISRVVGGYLKESYRYPVTVPVDSIYSSLKRKGWTKTQTIQFIINLEDILNKEGVNILRGTNVNLKTYNPTNPELRSLMFKHKPAQDLLSQNHDLAVIEKIRELRGKPARRIGDSKAFFLTSDGHLSRFNFMETGHKEDRTICEVILDRLLTNILWLRDPSTRVPLKLLIAAYSRDLFIKRRVWDRFYEALKQLRQEEKVQDENIEMLFYHGYIENVLRELDETEADKITPEFALEEIEKAAKLRDEETDRKIRDKEKEFLQRLKEEVSEKEREKEKEWLERIQRIKKNISKTAEKSSKKLILSTRISVATILAIPIAVCLATKNWDALNSIIGVLTAISFIVGVIIGSISRWWEKLEEKWFNKIYTKKMQEAGLNDSG